MLSFAALYFYVDGCTLLPNPLHHTISSRRFGHLSYPCLVVSFIVKIIVHCFKWIMWKERNNRTFEAVECPSVELKMIFHRTLYEWMTTLSGHSFLIFWIFLILFIITHVMYLDFQKFDVKKRSTAHVCLPNLWIFKNRRLGQSWIDHL